MKSAPCLLLAFALAMVAAPVRADEVMVDMPGVQIYGDEDGATVSLPGVHVQAQQPRRGVAVMTQGAGSYANADLVGMDFSNQDLSGADFSNATLSGANFYGSNLTGANFSNADMMGVNFMNARLMGARFTNATLSDANLTNADFTRADLSNATLDRALAVNTRFDGAILTNVDMSSLVRHMAARPVYIDSSAIGRALVIDPAKPHAQRRLDLTINFDFNSDKLSAQGAKQVQAIAAALSDPALRQSRIMVEGHTDSVGSDSYNQDLSYRRAMRVLQTLVEQHHVPPAQLSAKGLGETRPVASNDNDLGQAMNRRVTLVNMGR